MPALVSIRRTLFTYLPVIFIQSNNDIPLLLFSLFSLLDRLSILPIASRSSEMVSSLTNLFPFSQTGSHLPDIKLRSYSPVQITLVLSNETSFAIIS